MDVFLMLLANQQEFLDYVTAKYGERGKPAQKEWNIEDHFNNFPEDLDDMLLDLFTRYHIDYSTFNLDNYFMPDFAWWQFKQRKEWQHKKFKPLTLEMIIESAKVGRWLY